jgi:hypothetical protein
MAEIAKFLTLFVEKYSVLCYTKKVVIKSNKNVLIKAKFERKKKNEKI